MKLCIQQPLYLPYPGFFDKIYSTDKCIIFDTAQFVRRNFQNRNRIRVPKGFKWLTVPVKSKFGDAINKVVINNNIDWKKEHWLSIEHSYGNSEYFEDYKEEFLKIYTRKWDSLLELDLEIIMAINKMLGLKKDLVLASSVGDAEGEATAVLIGLCKKVGAKEYLSGEFGKEYLNEVLFQEAGIQLSYQIYKAPHYKQRFEGFEPNMSVLDIIFNHGPDTLKMITNSE